MVVISITNRIYCQMYSLQLRVLNQKSAEIVVHKATIKEALEEVGDFKIRSRTIEINEI